MHRTKIHQRFVLTTRTELYKKINIIPIKVPIETSTYLPLTIRTVHINTLNNIKGKLPLAQSWDINVLTCVERAARVRVRAGGAGDWAGGSCAQSATSADCTVPDIVGRNYGYDADILKAHGAGNYQCEAKKILVTLLLRRIFIISKTPDLMT